MQRNVVVRNNYVRKRDQAYVSITKRGEETEDKDRERRTGWTYNLLHTFHNFFALAPASRMEVTKELLRRCHALKVHPDSPLIVMAPMVRQSELAFRMQCRSHNVPLAYTPMIPASWYARCSESEREQLFQTMATSTTLEEGGEQGEQQPSSSEGPVVAQLCGNEADAMCSVSSLDNHCLYPFPVLTFGSLPPPISFLPAKGSDTPPRYREGRRD